VFLTNVTRLLAPLVGGETPFSYAVRHRVARVMPAVRFGSDVCHVLVRAEGHLGRGAICHQFSLSSRSEACVTGVVAAETVRMLLDGERRPGVLHLEQLARPRQVLERIRDSVPGTSLRL
jgi:hypothetical protein